MAVLNNPIFPLHKNTFQGIASDVTLEDKPYKSVHADEEGDITVAYPDDAGTVITISLGVGEDVSVAGAIIISSTASIKVS